MATNNLADPARGAKCLIATSCDPAHPPENVIDGNERTFWVTTGMFPQEIVVSLGAAANVASVTIRSVGLRRISLHSCTSEQPTAYEAVMPETELPDKGERPHVQSFALKISQARHVKLIIHEGYSHFVAVSGITIES